MRNEIDTGTSSLVSIVPDTSVVVKWFLTDEPLREEALGLRRAFIDGHANAIAPAHLPIELATALTKAVRRGRFDQAQIPAAVAATGAFELVTADITGDAVGAARLAEALAIHPADALFVVTALARDALLVTADLRLLEAARAAGCRAHGLPELGGAAGEGV